MQNVAEVNDIFNIAWFSSTVIDMRRKNVQSNDVTLKKWRLCICEGV